MALRRAPWPFVLAIAGAAAIVVLVMTTSRVEDKTSTTKPPTPTAVPSTTIQPPTETTSPSSGPAARSNPQEDPRITKARQQLADYLASNPVKLNIDPLLEESLRNLRDQDGYTRVVKTVVMLRGEMADFELQKASGPEADIQPPTVDFWVEKDEFRSVGTWVPKAMTGSRP